MKHLILLTALVTLSGCANATLSRTYTELSLGPRTHLTAKPRPAGIGAELHTERKITPTVSFGIEWRF